MIPANDVAAVEPADAAPGTSRKTVIRWVGKGGLAVLDQGLISGSNFVISILLARWLIPEQYGAYAVALGINVLLFTVYQSLLLEPMSVFGGSSYRECLRGYLGSLFWIHIAASLGIFAAFGASALVARIVAPASVLPAALLGVTRPLRSSCFSDWRDAASTYNFHRCGRRSVRLFIPSRFWPRFTCSFAAAFCRR